MKTKVVARFVGIDVSQTQLDLALGTEIEVVWYDAGHLEGDHGQMIRFHQKELEFVSRLFEGAHPAPSKNGRG